MWSWIIFVVIVIIAIFTRAWSLRKKKGAEISTETNTPKAPTTTHDTTPPAPKKSKVGWICFGLLVAGIVIYFIFFSHHGEEASNSSSSSNSGETREVLYLVDKDSVGPGVVWITPKIDYKFQLRTEGHAISLQFSGDNGTWLEPVSYPTEGDFSMPSNARPGPVKVGAGKKETRKFCAELYRVIKVKI